MAQIQFERLERPKWKPPSRIAPRGYLQVLFDDLSYDRLHRNDKLSNELGRQIHFLDELSEYEVRKMIGIMRIQKYGGEKA